MMPLLFLLILSIIPSSSLAADYTWPLDTERAMTSSFGEYRYGHFHAGLDLKTWGQTGFPVKAVADGEVWRLRTSPWGYGKAVYLKLTDGTIVVYAHLSRFAPGIATTVKQVQHEQDRYTIDLYPEVGTFPVKHGEIIAYSGQSGAGGPHLHFELRDADNQPYNPLLDASFSLPDTIPPTITHVAFIPLGTASTVDGTHDPVVLDLSPNSSGLFTTSRRPILSGHIAPTAAIHDMANGAGNPFDVYTIRSFADDRRMFFVRYDRFSYDQTDLIELDRNFLLNVLGYGIFHNLFVAQGNTLPFYNGLRTGDGLLRCGPQESDVPALPPGSHELRIEASDFYGNTSTALLTFLVGTPSTTDTVHSVSSDRQASPHRIYRSTGGRIAFFDSSLVIGFPPDGLYDDSLNIDAHRIDLRPPNDLLSVGPTYALSPTGVPFAKKVTISLSCPAGTRLPAQLGVYALSRDRWWFLGNTLDEEHRTVSATTRSFTTYTLFRDAIPPVVAILSPGDDSTVTTGTPVLTDSVADTGSGIGREEDVLMFLDGKKVIAEYDPEEGTLTYEVETPLTSGRHTVDVRARDRAGNETILTHGFTVSK